MQLTAQQLAELLVGIARAQAASAQGLDAARSQMRNRPEATLGDLPLRLLLASLGRTGPDPAAVAKDLERLLGGGATPGGGPGADLDFSAPPP